MGIPMFRLCCFRVGELCSAAAGRGVRQGQRGRKASAVGAHVRQGHKQQGHHPGGHHTVSLRKCRPITMRLRAMPAT